MSGIMTHALWFEKAGTAAIRSEELPPLESGFCDVEAEYSAVSLGTEKLVFNGLVPPALWDEMTCPYMRGTFSFPLQYGYSMVGRIVRGPKERIGERVHLLHPHQTVCRVRIGDVHPVPENVPAARATLASNLETAVNAVWDAGVQVGDRAVVVGFGTVGSLVARVLRGYPGISLVVVDASEAKRALARKMGFEALSPEKFKARGPLADVAFHATAKGAGLQSAIEGVGTESKIIEMSWYGTSEVSLALGGSFHSRRKQILSSQVSQIATSQRARWDYKRRKDLVFRLLADSVYDEHITHPVKFAELTDVYPRLGTISESGLYCVVDYR